MTDLEYFSDLSLSGLELTQEQLQGYLADAQTDDALPTKDVVVDLFLIASLQPSQQE
jgi:hypothetical protein